VLAGAARQAIIQGPEGLCLGGMGVNGPLSPGDLRAIVQMFAWAMNPGLVAARLVHPHNLSRVRGVPTEKLPLGTTCAVLLEVSTYLGTLVPSSSGGHPASSSVSFTGPRSPLA
jgi:hypothetical protein